MHYSSFAALLSLFLLCTGEVEVSLVKKMMPVSGLKCDGNQSAYVLYPNDGKKYPLLSFAHGLTAWDTTIWFPYVLEGVAKSGYVVVAPEAGTASCAEQHLDQIRGLEWALGNSELLPHIDVSAGTGIFGHSMGGGSTITSASDAAAISKYNIKAAAAMHPAPGNNAPKIPILYLTGTKDTLVPSFSVFAQYDAANVSDKTFVNIVGSTHVNACGCPSQSCQEFCNDHAGSLGLGCPNTEDRYYFEPFDCYLKGDKDACTRVHTCAVADAQTGKALAAHKCYHAPKTELVTV